MDFCPQLPLNNEVLSHLADNPSRTLTELSFSHPAFLEIKYQYIINHEIDNECKLRSDNWKLRHNRNHVYTKSLAVTLTQLLISEDDYSRLEKLSTLSEENLKRYNTIKGWYRKKPSPIANAKLRALLQENFNFKPLTKNDILISYRKAISRLEDQYHKHEDWLRQQIKSSKLKVYVLIPENSIIEYETYFRKISIENIKRKVSYPQRYEELEALYPEDANKIIKGVDLSHDWHSPQCGLVKIKIPVLPTDFEFIVGLERSIDMRIITLDDLFIVWPEVTEVLQKDSVTKQAVNKRPRSTSANLTQRLEKIKAIKKHIDEKLEALGVSPSENYLFTRKRLHTYLGLHISLETFTDDTNKLGMKFSSGRMSTKKEALFNTLTEGFSGK
jgi:hypothetical protein